MCLILCDPMDCSIPGCPVLDYLMSKIKEVFNLGGVCSKSCPLSRWCHPAISSSAVPFSSYLHSFPASGSFPVSHFFTSGGQSIGVSASVLPMNIQGWLRFLDWGRWEWGSGWGIHVNPWLIHVNVWQNPLQYCKIISLQLIKINEKKRFLDLVTLIFKHP